jgi:16S rRNA (cytosine967-C5)-methyltransferase
MLKPQPGERVLDLCAAPGGKLTYMAQLMQNQGVIVGHDRSIERLKLLEENCLRLGVTCFKPASPGDVEPASATKFDRILLDAPCSNTGVMRRRIDLRWRIQPKEIERLRGEQETLLRQAMALLKPNGTLVYSTCSLEPEENRGVLEGVMRNGLKVEAERELLPFADHVDGAYAASLRVAG